MTGSSLSLLRPNAMRAYIVFTPSALFTVKYDESKVHGRVAENVSDGRYQAHFADRGLTTHTAEVINSDPQLRKILEQDLLLVANKHFGSVWLYGDSVSDFTCAVVNLSLRRNIRLINHSEEGSLLDRYLESWIRRFGTLA